MAIFRAKNTLLRKNTYRWQEQNGISFQVTFGILRIGVIKEKLGIRAKGRKVEGSGGLYHLREAQAAYNSDFTPENSDLRAKNTYFWNVNL